MSTPKQIIESTIDRKYERPKLIPPHFKTELIQPKKTLSLEQVLTSLAKPNSEAKNTFKSKPKHNRFSLINLFRKLQLK